MARFIATFFYVGLVPFAPGTFGSAAAIPFAYLLHYLGGLPLLLLATVAVFLIGWWATYADTLGQENHDPGEIVIDEVAGQWIALLPLSAGLWFGNVDPAIFPYPGWIAAFVFFRVFDIKKPWIIGYADRMETPFGVMLDDVFAGVLAAVCVSVLAAISHGVF